ncbi:MAG: TolC family protein, partial [Bacteroidaceae bacterium]|nr:TolC family protein [Bacteroidaceae bacterium]
MRRGLIILTIMCCCATVRAQTYTLQQCREMALNHSEELQKAGISVERAALDKQIAFAGYLPQIDASLMGVVMKNIDMSGTELILRGTYLAGITLNQPIFVGGKILTANKLAKVGQKVSEEQLRQQRQQCIADVD